MAEIHSHPSLADWPRPSDLPQHAVLFEARGDTEFCVADTQEQLLAMRRYWIWEENGVKMHFGEDRKPTTEEIARFRQARMAGRPASGRLKSSQAEYWRMKHAIDKEAPR